MVNYKYTEKDKLEYHEKYQYTQYEGVEFVNSYLRNRNDILAQVNIKINAVLMNEDRTAIENLLLKIHKKHKSDLNYSEANYSNDFYKFDTQSFLEFVLIKLYSKSGLHNKNEDVVFELIRKFEVTKRIYSTYEHTDKWVRRGSDSNNLKNYLLLSNIIAILISNPTGEKKDYIYLNTFLKINDLISSCIYRMNHKYELLLAKVAIEQEMKIFDKFIKLLEKA